MQPSLIVPIILKDLRANRWLFVAFFFVSILGSASNLLNPEHYSPLAQFGLISVNLLNVLLCLLTMSRVVHADPPTSDTAFLATRPISGTTLFFAKFGLIAVAIVLIPLVPNMVTLLLLGFDISLVLRNTLSPLHWFFPTMVLFAFCTMSKNLHGLLIGCVIAAFGFCALMVSAVTFSLLRYKENFNMFPMNYTREELAGMYWSSVTLSVYENKTTLLVFLIAPIAFFGIIWAQYYLKINTLRSAFLFTGAILFIGLLVFVGAWQATLLPPEAKALNASIPAEVLVPKLTKNDSSESYERDGTQNNRKSNTLGSFTFSNWPEDVQSLAFRNVTVSFSRDGQAVTAPVILPEDEGPQLHSFVKMSAQNIYKPSNDFEEGVMKYYRDYFITLSEDTKEIPINLPWSSLVLENLENRDIGDLILRMDMAVFQYKPQAILPLQVGKSAQFEKSLATVQSVGFFPRLRNVTIEVDEISLSELQKPTVYRLKTGSGWVNASMAESIEKNLFSLKAGKIDFQFRATSIPRRVRLTFPMPSTIEQADAPLDKHAMHMRMAEWLKDGELVVSTIAPAGSIQREVTFKPPIPRPAPNQEGVVTINLTRSAFKGTTGIEIDQKTYTTPSEIIPVLKQEVAKNAMLRVIVIAEKGVELDSLQKTLDALRQSGVENFSFSP
jgi:hypothetical protein